MAIKGKKIYAIFRGRSPGLYENWREASAQVKEFKGAKYKRFMDRDEAIQWLRKCVLEAKEPVDETLIALLKSQKSPHDNSENSKKMQEEGKIIIHTDGGASPNPGVGGYGVVMQREKLRKELSAGYELTTNNRMEMMACIVALEALKNPSDVVLHTDSKYVVDSINKRWVYGWQKKGWKKSDGQPALNSDLWRRLLPLLKAHKVEFKWVKGHAGNVENERCDLLANNARKSRPLLLDRGYLSH